MSLTNVRRYKQLRRAKDGTSSNYTKEDLGVMDDALLELNALKESIEWCMDNISEPCPGEAHSNAMIDNCMVCLGGAWGRVVKP